MELVYLTQDRERWRDVLNTVMNTLVSGNAIIPWLAEELVESEQGLYSVELVNLLKPTGYVMHHQFNIQQLYALPPLYWCVLYLSENKQRLVPLTA